MLRCFVLGCLLLSVSSLYATPYKECISFCQTKESHCINECGCRAKSRVSCSNHCFKQDVTCQTLCKVKFDKQNAALPVTHLPNLGNLTLGERCLAPTVNSRYAYW